MSGSLTPTMRNKIFQNLFFFLVSWTPREQNKQQQKEKKKRNKNISFFSPFFQNGERVEREKPLKRHYSNYRLANGPYLGVPKADMLTYYMCSSPHYALHSRSSSRTPAVVCIHIEKGAALLEEEPMRSREREKLVIGHGQIFKRPFFLKLFFPPPPPSSSLLYLHQHTKEVQVRHIFLFSPHFVRQSVEQFQKKINGTCKLPDLFFFVLIKIQNGTASLYTSTLVGKINERDLRAISIAVNLVLYKGWWRIERRGGA